MAGKRLIYSFQQRRLPQSSGNKAINLHRLSKKKQNIPRTLVCTWEAYDRYIANDHNLVDELKTELGKMIQPGVAYAIRSSANIEDSADRSFAGQFKTVLNVVGVNQVFQAIWSVWSSANAPSVTEYLESVKITKTPIRMAVIIQEMVDPVWSGVALSKNPVTGTDEVIVEAVKGSGASLVQGGATPYRWVNKWGYWLESSEGANLPSNLIEEIVADTKQIANEFGHAVDLEWVYNGNKVHWVQVREITSLKQKNVYSNNISREMIPGMVKPLIYSINIPLVNGVWIRWICEITGDLGIKPDDLAKSFFYRVYFNMGVLGKIFSGLGFPAESVEMLMGMLPSGAARPSFKPTLKTFSRLPWLAAFMVDKWRFAPKMRRALAALEPKIKQIEYQNLESYSSQVLLEQITCLYDLLTELAYYNVLGPLLMGMYNSSFSRMLAGQGVNFSDFDLGTGIEEFSLYDPSEKMEALNLRLSLLCAQLDEDPNGLTYQDLLAMPEAKSFLSDFDQLLSHFGHLSDSGNDFSAVPWRESPDLVFDLVKTFKAPSASADHKIRFEDLSVRGIKKHMFRLFYKRAREFRLLREHVSHLYTHAYGLFRYYFLALGRNLCEEQLIDQPEDVFYLSIGEIRDLAQGKPLDQDAKSIVRHHQEQMEQYRDIALPAVIFGDDLPLVEELSADVMVGVASSGGVYTGKVKVVSGLKDIGTLDPGDVLVVPYSDVSWTPLFRKAGAVIAESGGLLSHSSIVAREYGIPAVVNVYNATNLKNGTVVSVDGNQGKIFIHDGMKQVEV